MTRQKHFKQLVRDHMKKTGLRYAAARRVLLRTASVPSSPHRPGVVPAATALRVLLARHGRELAEPTAFGLAGGVGIGVFAFHYEKADFASFFVGGRHLWHDDRLYLTRACERLGLTPAVTEASTPRAAERNLREPLDAHGPCVAWVDVALLPHRGLDHLSATGGGYHVVTVYGVNPAAGTATIGDLADEPVELPLAALTAARGRIKKDKYRLLAVAAVAEPRGRGELVRDAVAACRRGMAGADAPANARRNFTPDALISWADRLTATRGPDRWEHAFAPGHRFFTGLLYLHFYVEHYGTGGGLMRPLMADFLRESGLEKPAADYARLGELWSDLADAALPNGVPLLAAAKTRLTEYAELVDTDGPEADRAACWRAIRELEAEARERFPLTPSECADLRGRLRDRVLAIHAAEVAALDHLGRTA
jgi:hypothetical protein